MVDNKKVGFFEQVANIKGVVAVVIAIFVAGIVSVVYLEQRFFTRFEGETLKIQVEKQEKVADEQMANVEQKIEDIQEKNTTILIELGKIQGKLDEQR